MNLNLYSIHLQKQGASKTTIKNYLSDARQFVSWRHDAVKGLDDPKLITKFTADHTEAFSPRSLKRKSSSIKSYLEFENEFEASPARRSIAPVAGAVLAISILSTLYGTKELSTTPLVVADTTLEKGSIGISNTKPVYSFERSKGIKLALEDTPPSLAIDSVANTSIGLEPPTAQDTFLGNNNIAEIQKGKSESLIVDDLINENSFVYLTPLSPTDNQTLYIKIKGDGYMVVAVEYPTAEKIKFQWKVDNSQAYHDIL